MKKEWSLLGRRSEYDGFFRVESLKLRHTLFRGGESPILIRELVSHAAAENAVAVLPYDPAQDCVLLVEQFRTGAAQSNHDPWLVEIVAGLVDPGEAPEATARRETEEETGCTVIALRHLFDYFASPGGFREYVSLYIARVDSATINEFMGVSEEGEDIRVIAEPRTQALKRLHRGGFASAPPIIALQWLQANHSDLRSVWSA